MVQSWTFKWINPSLVVVAYDDKGKPYYKCAFNTEACGQLNAWLGGFESIVKHMTPSNFNWFLEVLSVPP